MSIRVRLVLVFSLSAIAALAFFGFIAYDTAAQDNDKRETALLRQALAPLGPRLAAAVSRGDGIDPMLARWAQAYHGRLAVAVADADGAVLHASPNYRRFTAPDHRAVLWITLPLPSVSLTAHVGLLAEQDNAFSYLQQMRRSLLFAALIVAWLAGWAAMYLSRLIETLQAQKGALRHQALHDPLTDLANRSLLCQRLHQAVAGAAPPAATFALCFLDLDRFKEVNDTQGHLCGDRLLVVVGERLKRIVRKGDTVARLGGDEFAILLRDVGRPETQAVVEAIIRSIEEDILFDDRAYSISCSVGIAMYREHGKEPQTLLMHADIAMYAAKGKGLAWRFFEEGLLDDGLLPAGRPDRPVCVLQEQAG